MRYQSAARRVLVLIFFLGAVCLDFRWARAEEIEGVQPAALDQPRVNAIVQRDARGKPLAGESMVGGKTSRIEAFLDTGASGIMLSAHTADLLGVKREAVEKKEVEFDDVGVGGSDRFAVSEPLIISLAAYDSGEEADDPEKSTAAYSQRVGPVRAQVGPIGGMVDALMAMVAGDLDVVGMPAMRGKVVVLDTGAVNSFMDKIRTYVYDAQSLKQPNAGPDGRGIPTVRHHIKLGFSSFGAFTKTTPAGAEPPVIAANPFIGPGPVALAGGKIEAVPPLAVTYGGKKSSGAWLLDTGAAASMISRKQAEAVGVKYAEGTLGTDHPKLDGVRADRQFVMTIGGVGGSKKSAGFYLDTLTLQTVEGEPIVFKSAPVLVADITVQDSTTKKEITLDGVFGMNFLVATAKIDESAALPDLDHLTAGAFKWVIFDEPHALLGLEPSKELLRAAKR